MYAIRSYYEIGSVPNWLGRLLFFPQCAPQDLADVGLRQLAAELDVLRTLVAGELFLAEP